MRGPGHPIVFDGPVWAHTSPVYVKVAGQGIASRPDVEFFVDWIEQMLRVVAARNRYASVENRRQVETLFRKAQDEFRKAVDLLVEFDLLSQEKDAPMPPALSPRTRLAGS